MQPYFYLFLSAFLWGVNFHLLKFMVHSVHIVEAGFWRYLFGVAALALYARTSLPQWNVVRQHLRGILIVGIGGLFCFNILLFWGLQYTSSMNASLIISLSPLATLCIARVYLRTTITVHQLLGALCSVLGVLYLLSKGEVSNLLSLAFAKGDMLVLVAMLFSAGYHSWVSRYARNIPNQQFTLLTNLVCFLSFAVITPLFMETPPTAYSPAFWLAAFVFGVLGTALAYIVWNKGLSLLGATTSGMFMNIVPLSTAAIAVLLGEELKDFHIVSGACILVGLLISQRQRRSIPRRNGLH